MANTNTDKIMEPLIRAFNIDRESQIFQEQMIKYKNNIIFNKDTKNKFGGTIYYINIPDYLLPDFQVDCIIKPNNGLQYSKFNITSISKLSMNHIILYECIYNFIFGLNIIGDKFENKSFTEKDMNNLTNENSIFHFYTDLIMILDDLNKIEFTVTKDYTNEVKSVQDSAKQGVQNNFNQFISLLTKRKEENIVDTYYLYPKTITLNSGKINIKNNVKVIVVKTDDTENTLSPSRFIMKHQSIDMFTQLDNKFSISNKFDTKFITYINDKKKREKYCNHYKIPIQAVESYLVDNSDETWDKYLENYNRSKIVEPQEV